MSGLDDKLRGLRLEDIHGSKLNQLDMTSINEIKQAFADEILPLVDGMTVAAQQLINAGWFPPDSIADVYGGKLLGGQEWYDRFEKELKETVPQLDETSLSWLFIQKAAKKAGGL